jgi:hypothetical protein
MFGPFSSVPDDSDDQDQSDDEATSVPRDGGQVQRRARQQARRHRACAVGAATVAAVVAFTALSAQLVERDQVSDAASADLPSLALSQPPTPRARTRQAPRGPPPPSSATPAALAPALALPPLALPPPAPHPAPPSPSPAPLSSALLCSDLCSAYVRSGGTRAVVSLAANGACDDGGVGSLLSSCALGTDCADCGVRAVRLQSVVTR